MTSEFELGWIVALLDGEGSFLEKSYSPAIDISMIDYDTVFKAALILGMSPHRIRIVKKYESHHKQQYNFRLHGKNALRWMRILRPYMSERRGAKIDEIINIVITHRPNLETKEFTKCINPFEGEKANA